MELLFELKDIQKIATTFWKNVNEKARVFAFHGEMGAGKTTFIHAICVYMGVKDVVTSPTFSIINEYSYAGKDKAEQIFHIDLYRLKDAEEAIQAGIEDCLYGPSICFVEWPERLKDLFPASTLHIYLETAGNTTRKLYIRQ